MIQLNQVTELLHKMMNQQTQPLPKPLTTIPSPLPSQPLPNPKGGLNAINDKLESKEEAANTNNKEAVQQLSEKEDEEELPIKCEDSGPCLVTCRIKGFEIPSCLCDPGACGNIMPHALYEALELGPLKKTTNIFTTADCSIVSAAGIIERGHPQVLLGRLFLKTSSFRLTYADDIFTFSSGRTTDTFQISPPPKKNNR
ncbi:hypothetical protein PIB30_019590 [Stylosanthes scabra]|uniref:Uncharacterized protein n=1 Tax=Stylosanthes scabra TaxID=79078 RepID=A0ABU6Z7V1_9FABA|nr:hypothetical protein [Stylosanthes scabra]